MRPDTLALELIVRPWIGDFDGMVQRRRVRILTPYSKTHYFIENGVQRGIVFDSGMKLEQEINRTLNTTPATKVHVVFVPTPRDQLVPSLIAGVGDIIGSNLTVTAESAKYVDFTVPGQTNVKKIVVTGPGSSPLDSFADLTDMEIGLREGSVELHTLFALNSERVARGLHPIPTRTLPSALEDEDLLEMVNAGLLKATVVDDVIADFWATALPSLTIRRHIVLREGAAIAWAVRKNSPKLLAALNPIIEANRVGTSFGNITLQAYLRAAKSTRRATAASDLKRFHSLRAVFQRYAQQYELDYLLLMAQGYQESGLDHRATSRKGAIGIMQVMPATGRDMQVGDIRQLEANVHAGVKYVRVIIDRHLRDDGLDPLTRTLFAFAAYNCGPTCLRQLRAQTARRGLNPNLWFNNVERIAGEVVGPEPVEYVSRIYKHYIAYTLAVANAA
jgi:membrane-bound lytic murein transglycosylase MltF